jgi:ribosomal protein S18 acetylase RimI-like enzyme
VLIDDGQPAGWITAHRVGERLFRVSQWWVRPELQGRGIALLLLHQAARGALQSRHGYTIFSFGMDPDNFPAINFYKRMIAPFAYTMNRQWRASIALHQLPE